MTINLNQDGNVIQTIHPSKTHVVAQIFSEEQRQQIKDLMSHGYLPHHTSVGRGNCGFKHWKVEKYIGKFGKGFKMITLSPFSTNFNHLTYFTLA